MKGFYRSLNAHSRITGFFGANIEANYPSMDKIANFGC